MGRPKLILSIGGRTVIARVVSALREGGASPVVVVAPPRGAPALAAIVVEAEDAGALVVVPDEQPADMRASVERALSALECRDLAPRTILLVPADSPGLTAESVARVIEAAAAEPDRVIIPTANGRRGHPVAIPWGLALSIRGLPSGVGVNALVGLQNGAVVEIEIGDPGVTDDLDTPEDFRRWASAVKVDGERASINRDGRE